MKRLYILVALAVALAIANASVFVYYTGTINISTVPPPIIFAEGSNARQPDLAGNTIEVTISNANTTLSITVHPTYQTNYYKDLVRIVNQDTRAYNVYINVTDPLSVGGSVGGNLTSATLIVKDATTGTTITTIDLTTTGTIPIGQLSRGSQWRVDLQLVLNNVGTGTYNQAPKITDASATIQLIYSPSTETPP